MFLLLGKNFKRNIGSDSIREGVPSIRDPFRNGHINYMAIRISQDAQFNPFMPTGAFNICCPRDCVSRHNGGTSGVPLKHLRVDSALRALSKTQRWAEMS